jgi:signal transduction histidine kinase/CheY-like chemotaxis protein
MNWTRFVHPEDVDRYLTAYAEVEERRGDFVSFVRLRRADGAYRDMKTVSVPRYSASGDFLGYIGSTYDITDVRRAEQTTGFLADASAALADLTDSDSTLQKVAALAVPQFSDWCAIDVVQPDGSIRRLAVAGSGRGYDLQRGPASTTSVPGSAQVIHSGRTLWIPAVTDDGVADHGSRAGHESLEPRLTSCICVPLSSRTQVLGALTFITAESGRVYDSSDVRAAEDLAHRTVIAIENATLLARLKEDDRLKDEFLAMLAHELRNPLAPIQNAAQIMRLAPPAPETQPLVDVIERQVWQMTRLVDDLLDVSRITRGQIALRPERVELANVVRHAVEASRALIDKRGHNLTVTMLEEPLFLEADPIRLQQVVANLLQNAAKYTDEGGRIDLVVERDGAGTIVLRVSDNGVGIPLTMQQRIFDLFTQVDRTLERSEGGLGIGLTLVKRLVEMHGGTVTCRSAGPGTGSEFSVRLPLAAPAVASDEPPAVRIPTPASHRILVVDNNRDAADSLAMLLRMAGHQTHTAYDGQEALVMVGELTPDVVMLDIGLPNLNGYEVARRIREQGGTGPILIAVTGWGSEDDYRQSLEAGFDEHLTKPVEFAMLRRILSERLQQHASRG